MGAQRFLEPAGWAEEILDAATTAELPQLPRLSTAAALRAYAGRAGAAIGYAQAAVALQADPHYDPFDVGWSGLVAAAANGLAGRHDPCLQTYAHLRNQPGSLHYGFMRATFASDRRAGRRPWPSWRRPVAAAREHGNPS